MIWTWIWILISGPTTRSPSSEMSWKAELPDGTLRVFPNSVSPWQATAALYRENPELFPDAPSGFFAAVESGSKRLLGHLAAAPDLAYGAIAGDDETFQRGIRTLEETDEWASEALPVPVSPEDIGKAMEEEGVLGAIGPTWRWAREVMGGSVPYMVPMGVAGKVAAGPGSTLAARAVPALRVGASPAPSPMTRAAIGHAAGVSSMIPAFFADNLAR